MFKSFNIFISLILLLVIVAGSAFAGSQPDRTGDLSSAKNKTSVETAPQAVFPEVRYTFDPVYEDTEIKHDFIVENQGDAPLIIQSIRPD